MKSLKYQKLYYVLCLIYAIVLAYAFYECISKQYMHSLMMCFVSLVLAFCIPIGFKLMKWKPVYEIYILAIIFMFLASVLGSSYRFYDHVLYWDKYVHCFSGVLGGEVAYLLFCLLKKTQFVKKEDRTLLYVFINAVNIAIAALWELFEYAGLVFFDYDGIRHYTTGVHDSMSDILVCIIGGLVTTYFIYRFYHTGKDNIFSNINQHFHQINQKNDS
ncbi:MAG: hypothetical protein EOM50_06140 [Erysipelotrichia bacterium]|nr:hypothetical protein [Erysipelotrichia bacterium]NCC54859.1 hypothetical protein [Erysipelotrichia bacterium]